MNNGLRKGLFFILLLGLAYVAHAYMIKPANMLLKKQKAQTQQKLLKLEELEKAKAAADDLNRQLQELQGAIEFFESKLPHKSQVHKVLENVTIIAQKHGLVPKTIRTLKQKNNNGYMEQPLKMELQGDFKSYYSFLLELEKLDRITKIRELSLNKRKEHQGQVDATFVISIFFQDGNK